MGFILAGILVCVLLFAIMIVYLNKKGNPDGVFGIGYAVGALALFSVLGGLIIGIAVPISGYEKPQAVSTTELVSLRDDTVSEGAGNLFYVAVSGTNSYTYYVEVDSYYVSDSQKAYKSKTISNSNVTIVEDDSYTDAKLVTYVIKGKKTFWTFAAGIKRYEYVFYVPTGTIIRDVSLG